MKKRTVFTLIGGVLAFFLIFKIGQFIVHALMFSHHGMGAFRHHGGPRGFHHDVQVGNILGNPFAITGWAVAIVLPIALILIGFVLWKSAKNNGLKKWAGISILVTGMILLLPKVILIPLTLIVAYMACKSKHNNGQVDFSYDGNGQAVQSNTDFLDHWEKKTKMEE
ncbi:hypothetical protein [Ferdinandcohnia sp. Marseille-Q9671]